MRNISGGRQLNLSGGTIRGLAGVN